MGRPGAGKASGSGAARARALCAILLAAVGWSLWTEALGPGPSRPACEQPVASERQPERVECPAAPAPLAPAPPMPLGARRALGLPADLNALSAEDLATLPGVGPKLAQRIVERRRQRGGFRSIDELSSVKGIGPARLAALRAALEPPRR